MHHQIPNNQNAEEFYAVFQGVLKAAERLVVNERRGEYGPPQSNFIYPDESYLQMLWVKISRLINLVNVKREELSKSGWEGYNSFDRGRLADSLIDLVNYTAFWAADVALAGSWPKSHTAQPLQVAQELLEIQVRASVEEPPAWPEGQEPIRCPKCQNDRSGFFGRKEGQWFIGCTTCGYTHASASMGSLFLWYTGNTHNRNVRRNPVVTQTKPQPLEYIPPVQERILKRMAIEGVDEDMPFEPEVLANISEDLVKTIERQKAELAAIDAEFVRRYEEAAAKLKAENPPETEDDTPEPPSPAEPLPVSEDTPVERMDCFCGGKLEVFAAATADGKKRRLHAKCACGFDRKFPDLTQLQRALRMKATEGSWATVTPMQPVTSEEEKQALAEVTKTAEY